MLYTTNPEAFASAAQELHTTSGGNARIAVKYRHREGLLIVRVTTGDKSIKFKTGDKDEIRHVERLQQWFMTEMCNPAGVRGSAEHAAAGGGSAASAAAPRRPAAAEGGISGAMKRKAARAAVAAGGAVPAKSAKRSRVEERRAAARARKLVRREDRRLLAAASAPPVIAIPSSAMAL